jgi:hypothetical protein
MNVGKRSIGRIFLDHGLDGCIDGMDIRSCTRHGERGFNEGGGEHDKLVDCCQQIVGPSATEGMPPRQTTFVDPLHACWTTPVL